MKLTRLFTDDDAVSPVIAVVLMLAIVVILSGIVATFVLGSDNKPQDPTPTTDLEMKYVQTDDGETAGFVEIVHDGGDGLPPARTYVRGSGFRDPTASPTFTQGEFDVTDADTVTSAGSWPAAAASGSDSRVVSADQMNVAVDDDYDLKVVYESEDGERSAIIQEDTGPGV